jgi:hypothetical protein
MKLIGLISPNLSEDTLVDVYKILPAQMRIEGRALRSLLSSRRHRSRRVSRPRCPNSHVIWDLPPESGYDLATSLLREHLDVDGIYMPCNKWRIVSMIDRIEKKSGKPVVTPTHKRGCGKHYVRWG